VEKEPTKTPDPKDPAVPELPLTPDDATQVKGGAIDIFAKIGDIKGESRR
jgi:hypothetical protein